MVGTKGQLGSDICAVFADTSRYIITKVNRAQADLEVPGTISRILKQLGSFDYLINCAAMTNTEECEKFPRRAYRINTQAVHEMAATCAMYKNTFIHFSTDYVFDGKKMAPYLEDDQPKPLNVYGRTKLWGENAVTQVSGRYFIFRIASLFGQAGKSSTGNNFIETIIHRARAGEQLTVVNNQFMSPTHTLDVARTLRALVENGCRNHGIYHCSCAGGCSWSDFAAEILAQSGICAQIRPVPLASYPAAITRPAYSVLDTTKIKKIFPPRSWQEALCEYLFLKGHLR
ncbi:MAG: dTDP-4-dehydrorhamnose reductase [Bacillota bacterium]|nr:dTDP-4-dehydrorhamnose reductase [Bacillota bacterium]